MDQGVMRGGNWFCTLAHYEEKTRADWQTKSKVDMKKKCRNLPCPNVRPGHFWEKLKKGQGLERDGNWFCSLKCYEADVKRQWRDERERYLSQKHGERIHKVKFGALLLQEGAITPEQLESALERSKMTKKRIGESLLEGGDISEEALTKILSRQEGIPKIDLSRTTLKPEVISLLNKSQAKKYRALPIEVLKRTNTLVIAISNPSDRLALIDLKYITGYNIEPFIVPDSSLITALKKYYSIKDNEIAPMKNKGVKESVTKIKEEGNVTKEDIVELKNAVNVILSSIKDKGAKNFDMRLDGHSIEGSFDYGNINCSIRFKKR
jgi:hypothetical protein